MPRVTVVLPFYNARLHVTQALDSLAAQDYADFEIVAVDDGSTDDSAEFVKRHASRARVIEARHLGPAAARNLALSLSDSEFIAFMDADDLCSPNRLRAEVEEIERSGADLVASALSFIDADGTALPGAWRRPSEGANEPWGALLERNWIGTPSVLVRRLAIEQCGGFDVQFTHAEDYDLWLRLGADHRIGYIDSFLVECRRHRGNTSGNIEAHQAFERLALQKVDAVEAKRAFDRLYPGNAVRCAEAWVWFLMRSGNADFLEQAREVLSRHPDSHAVQFALGVLYYECGEWIRALNAFAPLQHADPASRNNTGVLTALCGDVRSAQLHFSAALGERPDYYDAHVNLEALKAGRTLRLTRRPLRESLVPMAVG